MADEATSRTAIPADSCATPPAPPPSVPDHQLIRPIGSGSYGEVWLARNVMGSLRAVKVVYRKSFDSERPFDREFGGIKRFEPISRSHEGFVDILQVGRDDQAGYFYYVMELADDAGDKGERSPAQAPAPALDLAEPCADAGGTPGPEPVAFDPATYIPRTVRSEISRHGRLPIEECLQLALSLTSALSQLHKRGLVHRDIKPSNIIFVNGQPKLADIGLVASVTEARSFVGTAGFIPPEGPGTPQADLYSLGKVLYEMSTGKDRTQFPECPTLIREMEDGRRLMEFNEVVLKACQNDPRKRYQNGEEMLADLALLQMGKSVRQLRSMELKLEWLTRIGVLVLVMGLLAGGALWYQRIETRRAKEISEKEQKLRQEADTERRRALAAEAAERQLRQKAEAEEKQSDQDAQQLGRFVLELLYGSADPWIAPGRDTRLLRQSLDATVQRIDKELTGQSEVQAQIRSAIGVFYWELGEYKRAEAVQRQALETFRQLGREKEMAESLDILGVVLGEQKRTAEAEAMHREALAIYRKLGDSAGVGKVMRNSAGVLLKQKKFVEAEAMYRSALALLRQVGDEEGQAGTLNEMGAMFIEQKHLDQAEQKFRESLEMCRRLGNENAVAGLLDNLSGVLRRQHKLAETQVALRELLTLHRKLNHTNELKLTRQQLVDVYREAGNYGDAEQLFEDFLKAASEDSRQRTSLLRDRADFFARRGKWQEAAADATKVMEATPKDHVPYHMLAPLLVAAGEAAKYRELCQNIVAQFHSSTDPFIADRMAKDCLILPSSGVDLKVVSQLAETAVKVGKSQSALPYFQLSKGLAEFRQGNFTTAVDWVQRSIDSRSFPNDTNRYVAAYMVLAMANHQLKHADDAHAALSKGNELVGSLRRIESADVGSGWRDWIIAQALVTEARDLIAGQPAAPGKPPKEE